MKKGFEQGINPSDLISKFPCLKKLEGIVENSAWHDHDDILRHTETVVMKARKIIEKDIFQDYFNQYIGESGITKGEALMVAAAFHDIAKPETIKTDNNGITLCSGHEILGSKQAKKMLKGKFNASVVNRVAFIIGIHDMPHMIISPDKTENQISQGLERLKEDNGDIFFDLIVLGMADTKASQLKGKNPDEFNFRIAWYEKILKGLS